MLFKGDSFSLEEALTRLNPYSNGICSLRALSTAGVTFNANLS